MKGDEGVLYRKTEVFDVWVETSELTDLMNIHSPLVFNDIMSSLVDVTQRRYSTTERTTMELFLVRDPVTGKHTWGVFHDVNHVWVVHGPVTAHVTFTHNEVEKLHA